MDEGGSPLFIGLGIVCVCLLILLISVIILCKDTLRKKLQKRKQGESIFQPEDVTEEEIISMVNEGHEQGVLEQSEAEMIHNIFAFDDKEVKDIMTHRKNLITLDGQCSYYDAVSMMMESKRSRYPVYDGDIDHIIGVLHIKDAFAFSQKNEIFRSSICEIDGLIRDVEFVTETMKINDLFRTMQNAKSHMAVVVDEYGQTSGLVAMEDILEEIVGKIMDEHDQEEEAVMQKADGSYEMDGLTELSEVAQQLNLPMDVESFDTLNGFLISLLDKIPDEGDTGKVSAYGYDFWILEIEDKIIRKVKIVPQDSRGKEEEYLHNKEKNDKL